MLFIFSLILFVVFIIAGFILKNKAKTVKDSYDAKGFQLAGNLVHWLSLIWIIPMILSLFVVIPAGHVGVIDTFGVVSNEILTAGPNIVNPLSDVKQFSIQTKEIKETMKVLSKEGLTITLEISALYRLSENSATSVYKDIAGGNYEEIILMPLFRSTVRAITASYNASALYSTERDKLAIAIQEELSKAVTQKGVIIETTPLRNVGLPEELTQSIEQKQKADQESQRMEFVLTKEKQEAERKRVEAQGIADFQRIVSSGISEPLLRWKGIEATEKLAHSENTKVIIVGAGKDGLPLIMDTK